MTDRPTFILAGNGPYENRGCEAIVRGTVKIIRQYYHDPLFICISFFDNEEQYQNQCFEEFDQSIIHKKANNLKKRYDFVWWTNILLKIITPKANMYEYVYSEMFPYIKQCKAVLSIGGDNYSLDYGIPRLFTGLDDIVLKRKKILIIWGASIGPFDKNQNYERYVLTHFKTINAIFARESATINYLEKNNICKNVVKTVDPAFLMDPVNPIEKNSEIIIKEGSIGINLSPLMAKYVTNGNMDEWKKVAAEIISLIAKRTLRTIYLVPHVDIPNSSDYVFLNAVLEEIDDKKNIILINPKYNAAETKWIISQMYLFAGARTHSTIAALSSGVPTLSFAYSIKAKGINNDIFGNDCYCLDPLYITPEIVVEKIEYILANYFTIKNNLMATIERMKVDALFSGKVLREVIG